MLTEFTLVRPWTEPKIWQAEAEPLAPLEIIDTPEGRAQVSRTELGPDLVQRVRILLMDDPTIRLVMHQRNAWFRAWRGLGMPILGGWVQVGTVHWRLRLSCAEHGEICDAPLWIDYPPWATEENCIKNACARGTWGKPCARLQPMRRPPPEGFAALYELELLAG